MVINYYIFIALVYLIIISVLSLIAIYVFNIQILSRKWIAAVVIGVAAIFGGIIGNIFSEQIAYLSNLNESINIFPPICTAVLALILFSKFESKK